MKTLTALLIALALIGCYTEPQGTIRSTPLYYIYIIDSCEYVGYIGNNGNQSYYDWMTHKGNCKFCKQRTTPKP